VLSLRELIMAIAKLAGLSEADRKLVTGWLEDFDNNWHEKRLAAQIRELPRSGPVRAAALVEMVKIDLDHQWQGGRHVRLEAYLKALPELGTADTVDADLILAEYQARQGAKHPPKFADFVARFPNQAVELRRLLQNGAPAQKGTLRPASSDRQSPSPGRESLPEQFGRYRIIKELGKGGMGRVYLAHDLKLDRKVAVKVPHFAAEDSPNVRERFFREAKAAAHLDHPNVCPVYDVGEIDGIHYLTMAYIDGKPLSQLIQAGKPLPQRGVAALVRKLAQAMHHAHTAGVIHRDLKPANVMINKRKEPVIMDFGLARRVKKDARVTQSGQVMGTPAYMPPEQVMGDIEAVGPASDVYSLGAMMYELLTGRLPYTGGVGEIMAKNVMEAPEPLRVHRPDLDPALEAICLKALAKEPAQRFSSMAEMAAQLGQYLKVEAVPAKGLRAPAKASPAGKGSTESDRLMSELVGELVARLDSGESRAAAERRRFSRWSWVAAAILVLGLGVVAVVAYRNAHVHVENTVVVKLNDLKELSDPTIVVFILDGKEISREELAKDIHLSVGKHELVTKRANGSVASRREINIGDNKSVDVSAAVAVGPPPQEPDPNLKEPGPKVKEPNPKVKVPDPKTKEPISDDIVIEPSDKVKSLIPLLTDPKVEVRRQAAESLGKNGDPTAVPALIERVADNLWGSGDGDSLGYSSKKRALEALKKLGATKVTQALLMATKSQTMEVRQWACWELAEQKDEAGTAGLIAAVKEDESPEVRVAAAKSLFSHGLPAVPTLLRALFDKDVTVRREAAFSLTKLGDRKVFTNEAIEKVAKLAVAPLMKRVTDDLWQSGDGDSLGYSSKKRALEALKTLGKEKVTEALVSATKSDTMEVREWACWELAEQKDEASAAGLLAALKNDPAPRVRVAAASSLPVFGASAAPALALALFDKDLSVRQKAANGLNRLGDRKTLAGEVVDKVAEVAVPALMKRVADDLWGSGDGDSVGYSSKLMALEALRTLAKTKVTPALIDALRSKNEDVRIWAIWQLGQLSDKEVFEGLSAAMKDDSPRVREAAAKALEKRK
jgi:serine/threonine protein kinase/HEAT repeat protein